MAVFLFASESQENRLSNCRLLETNFCGAFSWFQLPSEAPSPRFANLEEQGLASVFPGTSPVLQGGTCSYGKWDLTFKPLWPMVITKEAKAEGSKGGGALRTLFQGLQKYLEETFKNLFIYLFFCLFNERGEGR